MSLEGFYDQQARDSKKIPLKRSGQNTFRLKYLKPLAVAASFLFLLTASWFVLNPNQEETLESMSQEESKNTIEVKEQPVILSEEIVVDKDQNEIADYSYNANVDDALEQVTIEKNSAGYSKPKASAPSKETVVEENESFDDEKLFAESSEEFVLYDSNVEEDAVDMTSARKMKTVPSAEAIVSLEPKLIRGNVRDVDGNPLIGVTIESQQNVVNTDAEGAFEIALEDMDEELTFSFAGYNQEKVKTKATVNEDLEPYQVIMSKTIEPKVTRMSENEVIAEYKKELDVIFEQQFNLCSEYKKTKAKSNPFGGSERLKFLLNVNENGVPFVQWNSSEVSFDCKSEIEAIIGQLRSEGVFYSEKPLEFEFEIRIK